MNVTFVSADQLGFEALATEGPAAKIRLKFAILDDELAIGNFRHHRNLVHWLLQNRLQERLPPEICAAQPVVEEQRLLTIFGNVMYNGELELTVYITPRRWTKRQAEAATRQTLNDVVAHHAA